LRWYPRAARRAKTTAYTKSTVQLSREPKPPFMALRPTSARCREGSTAESRAAKVGRNSTGIQRPPKNAIGR
jgi:hypothetical protein